MKSFIKLLLATLLAIALIFVGANLLVHNEETLDKPYLVEVNRLLNQIENNQTVSTDKCQYVTNVEKYTGNSQFYESNNTYIIREINGEIYRFDYSYIKNSNTMQMNIALGLMSVVTLTILIFVYFRIILPFNKIKNLPYELAKGNLTTPLKENKGKYFGKFIWGLDLLREKLETQKISELALQKEKKTLIMSISHDIKTPLGVIELYAKALEKKLYKDEKKQKEVAISISKNCNDIKCYVDKLINDSSNSFMDIEVKNSNFYLSYLVKEIKDFYTEKLNLLKIDFKVGNYNEIMLDGDLERSVEVLQNIMENAIKYGDGKSIEITFSQEEDCQTITILNTGCSLSDSELPHIFDSFWRGSNKSNIKGNGLGLYICRQLMHKMNGEIFAECKDCIMSVTTVFRMS